MQEAPNNILTLDDLLSQKSFEADVTLKYARDSNQFGQLFLPTNTSSEALPVIILIHGGCWRARVNLDYFTTAAKQLSNLGFAVWNLEYRRIENGGAWPNTFLDVAKGCDYLREIAATYNMDLNRIIAVGHSAGGHLAHWLASRYKLPEDNELYIENPIKLKGFISLAGIPDLSQAVSLGICDDQAPAKLMGGLPSEVPERYAQGSPHLLAPIDCRQVFIQGQQDDIVPFDYVANYVSKAKERNETIKLISLDNTGHFEIVMPATEQWTVVELQIEKMIRET